MYNFSQLLIRNLILGVAFNLVVAVGVFFIFSSNLVEKQVQAKSELSNLSQFYLQNKQNDLSKYSLLEITFNEQTLKHSIKPDSLLSNALLPLSTTFTTSEKLNISYQINSNNAANVLLLIILISVIASLIIIFLACFLSASHTKNLIFTVNKQIKDGVARVISSDEITTNDDLLVIPDLKASLEKVKSLLSENAKSNSDLEKEAYIEPLTKLENRNRFVQFFANDEKKFDFGVLAITRCSELQTVNQIHGYHEGDKYICSVADIIKSTISSHQGAKVYRLNSSDFAMLLPNVTLKKSEEIANEITSRFNEYQRSSDLDSVGYTGLVYFEKERPLGELLALADTGISVAQTKQINSWFSQNETEANENGNASYGNQNWRQEIDSVIQNQRVSLLVQPIKPNTRTTKVYGEILARFLNAQDDLLPTASFIAMAEKLDKIVAVDRMIIEKVLSEIAEKNLHDQFFGINISARSIHDEHFLIWLERRLLREPNIASKLIFEITEYGLQQNIKTSKRFIEMIHRVGSRLTVERFGVGLTSFKFFRDMKPDFIKMDSTYTRDIDEDKNNQYFLRLMVDLAHRLSINVLAESVESQEEKFTLEKLFIDGCQGFYIGKPEKL